MPQSNGIVTPDVTADVTAQPPENADLLRRNGKSKKALTDAKLKSWRAGADWHTGQRNTRRQEIPDGRGMYAVLEPSGLIRFTLRCRMKGGAQVNYPLGEFSDDGITLAQARAKALEAKEAFRQGTDLRVKRQEAQVKAKAAADETVKVVFECYFAEMAKEQYPIKTLHQQHVRIQTYVYPAVGNVPIGELKRSDIMKLLKTLKANNGARTSEVVYSIIRKVDVWYGVDHDDYRSPLLRKMWKVPVRKRVRKFTDEEIKNIWDAAELMGTYGAFVQFLMLTGARRGEAQKLTFDEISDDLSVWTLPAVRNKPALAARAAGKEWEHMDVVRPLSAKTQELLSKRPRSSKWVFARDGRPLTNLDKPKAALDKASGVSGWVIHDLRALNRTLLSRAGVLTDHAERCQGHVIGGIRGHYDRFEYFDEKKDAFERLAAEINKILNAPPPAKVVELKGARK